MDLDKKIIIMKHYDVEGSVFRLTSKQEKEFQKKYPDELRTDYTDEERRSAEEWIEKNGKFLFNIYYI